MTNLIHSKVYLAGNIQVSENSYKWRDNLTRRLNKYGITSLNPHKKVFSNQLAESKQLLKQIKDLMADGGYDKAHEIMKMVIRRDLRMVDVADFVIVKLEPEKPTYGTVHEIIIASIQRKPTLFVIDDKKKFPLWLLGLVDHNLIFENFDELMDYIKKIHNAPLDDLNAKYWKIFDAKYV